MCPVMGWFCLDLCCSDHGCWNPGLAGRFPVADVLWAPLRAEIERVLFVQTPFCREGFIWAVKRRSCTDVLQVVGTVQL